MKIYNGFSQTPTRNHTAAGIDFFIPNIDDNNETQVKNALEAFEGSYKVSEEEMIELVDSAIEIAGDKAELIKHNKVNFILMYFALKDKVRNIDMKDQIESDKLKYFIDNILTFDASGKLGVICKFSDMLFINSGIKVALEPYTSLEYKNKSGKGCQGWTVKACLVDEDYTGYCHLSLQYLWWDDKLGTIYVGDKLTQGTVQHIMTDDAEEISLEEYNEIMKNSKRGDGGFGSSDVKH